MLSSVSLRVPALDEHKEDIPDLAITIANLQFELADVEYREFDIAALNSLRNADWPGDLAQLDAVVRNLIQTSLGKKITLDKLPQLCQNLNDSDKKEISALVEAIAEELDVLCSERHQLDAQIKPLKAAKQKLAKLT